MRMLEDISQIKVGYFTVDVKITSTEDYGEFDHETKKITISNSISDLEKFNTLLHECFHAILFERGITSDGGFLFDKEKEEEQLVNQLTNGFIALLQDNPKIKKLISDCPF